MNEEGEMGEHESDGIFGVSRATLALVIAIVSLVVSAGANVATWGEARDSHRMHCANRNELASRVKQTEQFLKDNKEALILGIPRAVIVQQLEDRKENLRIYDNTLDC